MLRPNPNVLSQCRQYKAKYLRGEISLAEIARKTKRSKSVIRNHLKHLGVEFKTRPKQVEEEFHTPLFLFNRRLTHADLR